MQTNEQLISIRWSDLDPNNHMRHSAYYDFGAQHRVALFEKAGVTPHVMHSKNFGPIIFREECVFRREIKFEDKVYINTKIARLRRDGSRWTIVHEFVKDDGTLCAVITLDGAWLDIQKRKLANPTPQEAFQVMDFMPKTENFVWEENKETVS